MLLSKTLSQRGRGDKMAALLMKHIEKERKKLLTVTTSSNSSSSSTWSSSVKPSVKTFHTQRGQYAVYFTAATGESVHTSRTNVIEPFIKKRKLSASCACWRFP